MTESVTNMGHFERELAARATTYFGGASAPGWLDYMLWPWFERLASYGEVYPVSYLSSLDTTCAETQQRTH